MKAFKLVYLLEEILDEYTGSAFSNTQLLERINKNARSEATMEQLCAAIGLLKVTGEIEATDNGWTAQ